MSSTLENTSLGKLTTRPDAWRRVDWANGAFETAYRPLTKLVEGTLKSDRHLIMVTLQGGAERHEIRAADGYRFDGADRAGSISILPAGCERLLRLHNVHWRWAAVALANDSASRFVSLGPMSGIEDAVILGLLSEFDRLDALDGGLDPAYAETMSLALSHYVGRRFGGLRPAHDNHIVLPAWRLRRVKEYVDANLSDVIRISDLARCVELSEGHFHRAFRAATGQTPLVFIQQQRIDTAARLLSMGEGSIADVALQVGFHSPAYFARVFTAAKNCSPSEFRRQHAVPTKER
jgi:AraC family transcriptional regulator